MLSLHLVSPSSVNTDSACSNLVAKLSEPGSRSSAANTSVSMTVRCGYSTSFCATKPMLRLIDPVKGRPLYVILPESFPASRPPSAVRSVVFPLPDGPNIARISPGYTIPLIPLSIVFSFLPAPPPPLPKYGTPKQDLLPFGPTFTLNDTSSNYTEQRRRSQQREKARENTVDRVGERNQEVITTKTSDRR
uniref:Uncharacterized protein n=1 Tax=Nymphaea colorata TaxID=210225 RepID=A0A5K1CU38_9MAGN